MATTKNSSKAIEKTAETKTAAAEKVRPITTTTVTAKVTIGGKSIEVPVTVYQVTAEAAKLAKSELLAAATFTSKKECEKALKEARKAAHAANPFTKVEKRLTALSRMSLAVEDALTEVKETEKTKKTIDAVLAVLLTIDKALATLKAPNGEAKKAA
jgi:hypothetical protein